MIGKKHILLTISLLCVQLAWAQQDKGFATFYANRFEGKKTASGEVYLHQNHTCAHRSFAFGTQLKVTRIDNGKSTLVVVNDRGPHVKRNLIDLSQAAAKDLEMIQEGRVEVRIEVIKD